MSIYTLNSIVKKNDEKNLIDISNVLNKKNIWINHSLKHTNRLGWLDFNRITSSSQIECMKTIKGIDSKKFIFIGMGGSIQTGKVLTQILKKNDMLFIDSTNPDEIKNISENLNLEECIFVIMSKSGTTLETLKLMNFFIKKIKKNKHYDFGQNFIAITDKGTDLEKFALKNNFLKILISQKDIGGRFSSSTFYGILPYCLNKKKLNRKPYLGIKEINSKCSLILNAIYYATDKSSFKKINLKISKDCSEMGIWLEQLISESSGKDNKGFVPVISYLENEKSTIKIVTTPEKNEKEIELLSIDIDKNTILEDMYLWQIGIIILCKKINVYPFDEPDVESSKLNTLNILNSNERFNEYEAHLSINKFSKLINVNNKKDLLYLNLFIHEREGIKEKVEDLKSLIKKTSNIDSIAGFGPRYLHSVGQLQKGGPKNIWVVYVFDKYIAELNTMDNEFSELSNIYYSQLMGDILALKTKNINTYLINIDSKKLNPFDKIMEEIKELA
tara:strand:+ start:2742 stop:4247 length:1506 start_codon:yes stop_codon:yes gene_type:complete